MSKLNFVVIVLIAFAIISAMGKAKNDSDERAKFAKYCGSKGGYVAGEACVTHDKVIRP